MTELVVKALKTALNIFHMLKKIGESIQFCTKKREMEDIKKKTQIELLDVNNTISEMKNVLDRSNSKLDLAKND